MLFLKVPRKDGERVRKELLAAGVLDTSYDILHTGDYLLFPATRKWGGFDSVELAAAKRPARSGSLEDALSRFLTPSELGSVTTSFDIVGDIAIIEIPPALEPKEGMIGMALLSVHKNLRTVLKKLGPMEGEYRVRRVKRIAGEDRTETFYRESGVGMKLDLSKVYFSVRLAAERTRVAGLVREGERVLVLFAGVGPFALVISKQRPEAEVVAVELNPDAVHYLKENIALNKAKNVRAIEADAGKLDLDLVGGVHSFDRVVMPLPKSAHLFLPAAFGAVKDGGVVHFYTICGMERPFEEALAKAKEAAARSGAELAVLSQRIVRPYSPSQGQVVLDLKVTSS